ncbi:response regulator [Oligoflexia bacterium]|nr:response regulator [Oligoflexia bacterium]
MKDIIIVEDGCQERERLEQLFTNEGYQVVACESVTDAELVLQREDFRLAILDIGLNDKSGSYLFNTLRRNQRVSYVIIFTGNPSVHLKQRFMEEGAVDYIVKASPQAQNENFLRRVQELLGESSQSVSDGIALDDFLRYVSEKSQQLFLDMNNAYPECKGCGSHDYLVTFSHKAQMPPDISGEVICSSCGKIMDPEIE